MRTPTEIKRDLRLQRIREAAHAELEEAGPDALRPGRVARRARVDVDEVLELVPDLEAAVVDEVEQLLAA